MTTRARLLAILKEEPFAPHDYVRPDGYEGNVDVTAWAADLNARHRLKRLCEEIATDETLMEKIYNAIEYSPGSNKDVLRAVISTIFGGNKHVAGETP